MRSKVAVIGAGNVGATCAFQIARHGYADIVLLDIVEGLAEGKALDMAQAAGIADAERHIIGTTDYALTAGSAVAVITSGITRKPGMSRDDLAATNAAIVTQVTREIIRYSPNCIIVVVTNPLDAMVHIALRESGLPRTRVVGQSGVLDSARMRMFIAQELDVAVEDVSALVLGGHGDTMVPVPRLCSVGGVPLQELLPPEKIEAIVQRTIHGGAEIVSLLKTGSAFYSPGVAAAEMVAAIVQDRKRILPCAVYLEGEYGINGIVVGVPVKLGRQGVEQIVELRLTDSEAAALKKSAEAVSSLIQALNARKA
ncbi:MAG: malate dehydrogenase [Desulfobacterota bacterium]|nr:malate dehydrogenase [Thermodesulfobacteriota bacterium]